METFASGSIFNFYERLNQSKSSDIVRDLDLPKQKAELRSSRQQWNILLPGIKITEYRTREKNLLHFFEKKEHVVACIDVNDLMNFMSLSYDPNNWRLLIDSSKLSFESSITSQWQSSFFHYNGTFSSPQGNLSKCEITSRVNKIRGS
ncbi:uncharacterized protein TNIN_182211 [Trichonephila inaurata madagascariensis]|uniref:Uncharacterized protein n=1 Tax=Trichonephila inaurata madagascariensis TaxID=2747483 RepID=A0A8X6Y0H6_9ARAC|nr:uncharacterized protein TNIN_182211 [Trichonephila inaurata madagascariensis]